MENPKKRSLAQACTACYAKKVRCDKPQGKTSCSNCALYNIACITRLRKRKRVTPSAQGPNATGGDSAFSEGNTTTAASGPGLPHPDILLQLPPPSLDQQRDSSQQALWKEQCSNFTQEPSLAWPAGQENGHITGTVTRVEPSSSPHENFNTRNVNFEAPVVFSTRSQSAMQRSNDHETPNSSSYDGRSIYFPSFIKTTAATEWNNNEANICPDDLSTLSRLHAFDIPSRSIRDCWIDNYFKYCGPWLAVVDRTWLEEGPHYKPSCLLLQSVFLAGSRVSAASVQSPTSAELYTRAKALFLTGYEKNPYILIVSGLLLQWWNLSGPEQISFDSSDFWLRTAVGIAYQLGLHRTPASHQNVGYHRRLWWSLMARDSQISAAHGRPRTINPSDSVIAIPTVIDCRDTAVDAPAYVAHMQICKILGDVAECYRRDQLSDTKKTDFRTALYWWIKQLPDELCLYRRESKVSLRPYNFIARQLHIVYFLIIALIYYKGTTRTCISLPVLISSSCIAGILEDFLVRDEIRHLGPAIWKFYLLSAALVQLPGMKAGPLAANVVLDLNTFKSCLEKFSERWPSSSKNLKLLENLTGIMNDRPENSSTFQSISRDEFEPLLSDFGPEICRQWHLLANDDLLHIGAIDLHEAQVLQNTESQLSSTSSANPMAIPNIGRQVPATVTSQTHMAPTMPMPQMRGMEDQGGETGQHDTVNQLWPDLDEIDDWLVNI